MDALELLKSNRYDLLFMDARMPGIDGLKTTQFIRTEMNIMESEMPVVCISAAAVNEDWKKYQDAGMNAFLPKPFTEEMLMTTILSVIKDYSSSARHVVIQEKEVKPEAPEKINLNNLYHISGGDESFVKQMLISFIESTEKGLNELDAAVKSGNLVPVADLAHKMLPPCRHIAAMNLTVLLKKIEENIKEKGNIHDLEILIHESLAEFEIVRRLINEHLAKIS
jgi:CheY-like chemotaxis protein/HPt (histidine-containing phosphotransfer) domain-containing protein